MASRSPVKVRMDVLGELCRSRMHAFDEENACVARADQQYVCRFDLVKKTRDDTTRGCGSWKVLASTVCPRIRFFEPGARRIALQIVLRLME